MVNKQREAVRIFNATKNRKTGWKALAAACPAELCPVVVKVERGNWYVAYVMEKLATGFRLLVDNGTWEIVRVHGGSKLFEIPDPLPEVFSLQAKYRIELGRLLQKQLRPYDERNSLRTSKGIKFPQGQEDNGSKVPGARAGKGTPRRSKKGKSTAKGA